MGSLKLVEQKLILPPPPELIFPTNEECMKAGLFKEFGVIANEAPQYRKFMASHIRAVKREFAGKPFVLESWEDQVLDKMMLLTSDISYLIKEIFLSMAKGNGKSSFTCPLCCYKLVRSKLHAPEVFLVAATVPQAHHLYDMVIQTIKRSPKLSQELRPYKDVILCDKNSGILRVMPSSAKGIDGSELAFAVADEAALWPDWEPIGSLQSAVRKRPDGQMMFTTTAGDSAHTEYPGWVIKHAHNKDKPSESIEGFRVMMENEELFKWWESPLGADIYDHVGYRYANPSSFVDLNKIEKDIRRAERRNRLAEQLRYNLNWYTNLSTECWVAAATWHALEERSIILEEGDKIDVGIDIGIERDATCVTRLLSMIYSRITDEIAARIVACAHNDVIRTLDHAQRAYKRCLLTIAESTDAERLLALAEDAELLEGVTDVKLITKDVVRAISRHLGFEETGMYWFDQRFYTPTEDEPVSLLEVENDLVVDNKTYRVGKVYADPSQFRGPAEHLEQDHGMAVEIIKQSPTHLIPLSITLRDLAIEGRLLHGGEDDDVVARSSREILNSAKKEAIGEGQKWYLSKRARVSSDVPNDGGMSLLYAMGPLTLLDEDRSPNPYDRLMEEGKPLIEVIDLGSDMDYPNQGSFGMGTDLYLDDFDDGF